MKPSTNDLWLVNSRFDRLFFQISGILCLLLIVPYSFWGALVVIPIYNFYLIFFGLPHNYMTWASIFPGNVRSSINMRKVMPPFLICLFITTLLLFAQGDGRNFILTVITLASLWHAYRQHHGICKIYDSVQAKRSGDHSIFQDRKWLNIFFAFAAWGIVVWAYTHPEIKYLLSADEFYYLMYPTLPMWFLYLYSAVTVVIGIVACKKVIFDRKRRGLFIPWPQINLIGIALLTYIVPYIFMPIEAMPLAVAIATIYHNIQYFGFVWIFEQQRSSAMQTEGRPINMIQKMSLQGRWKSYFAIALLYSLLVIALYLLFPRSIGFILIYFIAFAHYIVDGIIWRHNNNKYLGVFLKGLVDKSPAIIPAAKIEAEQTGEKIFA